MAEIRGWRGNLFGTSNFDLNPISQKLFSVFAKKSNHCAMIATLTYLCTHIFKKTETKLNLRWKYTKLAKTNSFE